MSQEIIGFHYTLTDSTGALIDSSEGQAPLLFMVGSGQIIPGLEEELLKLNIGDKKKVEVAAEHAYGEIVEDLKIVVKRTQFPADADLKIGDQFQVNEDPEAPVFMIVSITDEEVNVDGNHPMAGKDLVFDVEVTEKRAATEEELAHGHAHGEGGHHH